MKITWIRGSLPAVLFLWVQILTAPVSGQPFQAVINIPPDPAPFSVEGPKQLNLSDGGVIGINFIIGSYFGTEFGTEVNITGGTVGRFVRVFSNATVNISGGDIGMWFNSGKPDGTGFNTRVNISGGSFGEDFEMHAGSTTNISGGDFLGFVLALNGSEVNLSGGTFHDVFEARLGSTVNISDAFEVQQFFARGASTVNVTGGNVVGNFLANRDSTVNISGGSFGGTFKVQATGAVNLTGSSFILDGVDLTPGLTPGVPVTITAREVALEGTFADHTPFNFDLNPFGQVVTPHFFSPLATLTISLVPEPGALVLLGAGALAVLGRGKRVG